MTDMDYQLPPGGDGIWSDWKPEVIELRALLRELIAERSCDSSLRMDCTCEFGDDECWVNTDPVLMASALRALLPGADAAAHQRPALHLTCRRVLDDAASRPVAAQINITLWLPRAGGEYSGSNGLKGWFARQVVMACGGSFSAEDILDRSRVTLQIPECPPPRGGLAPNPGRDAVATPSAARQAQPGAQCLLALDDDNRFLNLLGRLASAAGFRVQAAATATEFLLMQAELSAPVLALDVFLEKGTALDVMDHLARIRYPGQLILMSGFDRRFLDATADICRRKGLHVHGVCEKRELPDRLPALLRSIPPAAGEQNAASARPC